ncbi:MAG TPA: family 78 glycoside hydrolase catalytic domain [Paenibacillus sp.]|nr:family 78 glycoside hydrolase catalytic domain [Paenibacillus sp.]
MNIDHLRVNGLNTPLGLEDNRLIFSWQLTADRQDDSPNAVRVQVGGSAEALTGVDLIWDSGRLPFASQLRYDGPHFSILRRYWWKVGVWNAEGTYAESASAFFDTGLPSERWSADWIWKSTDVVINDFAHFFTTFTIGKPIEYAKLFISAHHSFKAFVNGMRVGGYGSPAPTNPSKRKYYLAYDIAGALRAGSNVLWADAHYLGGHGQNYSDGSPGFRAQLHVRFADGTELLVKSDSTWNVLDGSPYEIGAPYQQGRRLTAIEKYDARQWDDRWRLPAGGDAPTHVRSAVALPELRSWPMQWQSVPEGGVDEAIVPRKLSDGEDAQVFDVGKIVSGWPAFRLKGFRGTNIRLRYSEDLDGSGRVKLNVANETSEHYYDEYTMRGDAVEAWQPDFSYKAFRYIEVVGYPDSIEPGTELVVCSAHTSMGRIGRFRCSEELLNRLYAASVQTQQNNVLGQVTDCPHREQAQYLADTDLQAELLLYNFEALQVLEKTLADFADAQLDGGAFPFVAPTNFDHAQFRIQIPEWDLHFATLLWKQYWHSGDTGLLARYEEPLARMLRHYLERIDEDSGLVPAGGGWNISDWPYPSVEHQGNYYTVQQIKLFQALRIACDIEAILGSEAERTFFGEAADRLRVSVLAHLYDAPNMRFRDSSESTAAHQGVTALALAAGIVPDSDRAEAIRYIAGKPWESRTVLSLPLLRVLFDNGYEEEAYALIARRDYPGWGYMIEQGATTLWEGFEDIESHCHAWNGYPARLLQEFIVGIRCAAPGFAHAEIKPYMPPSLSFAEAEVFTVRGPVYAAWQRDDASGCVTVTARIPAAMTATLAVRSPQGTTIRTLPPGEHSLRLMA